MNIPYKIRITETGIIHRVDWRKFSLSYSFLWLRLRFILQDDHRYIRCRCSKYPDNPTVEKVNSPVRFAYHIGAHRRHDYHRRNQRRHSHHGHLRPGYHCCAHGKYYPVFPYKRAKPGGRCYETMEETEEADQYRETGRDSQAGNACSKK